MTMDYAAAEKLFFLSVATGITLSVFYDAFRLLRALGFSAFFSVFIQDVLFCLTAALAYILLIFNFAHGMPRFYAFAALAAGFLLCHVTLGALFMRCVDAVGKAVAYIAGKIRCAARCFRRFLMMTGKGKDV